MKKIFIYYLNFFIMIMSAGCASYFAPMKSPDAHLGAPTPINKDFAKLPRPKDKVITAVYKFRDQTGQYKPGGTWSTAVTQGATSILIKALEESGWFIPIEREGLSNLLNERQIIRTSRANYQGKNGETLPPISPLLYADIMLEGGIISYDSNILTGGSGLKYFGTGASGEYRQDQVSVYLRAISSSNGQVLKTVYTTKTILSQMVDVNLFKFVDFKRLLEVETGFSYNEPLELCVSEAIQKAVESLVYEGIIDGLWSMRDSSSQTMAGLEEYKKEKAEMKQVDYLGNQELETRDLALRLNLGANEYSGDRAGSVFKSFGEIGLNYQLDPSDGIELLLGRGLFSAKNFVESYNYLLLNGTYLFNSTSKLSPFLQAGGGILNREKNGKLLSFSNKWFPFASIGLGVRYMFNNTIGLNFSVSQVAFISDDLDNVNRGRWNDFIWKGNAGLIINFGK